MSALARMRALDHGRVQPAFAEISASASLRDRGLRASHTTGVPSSERARAIDAQIRPVSSRIEDLGPEDVLAPGTYVGSTLVLEETEGVGRAVHPSAGVLLVALVIEVRHEGLVASTQASHFMLFDRTIHTMVRPLAGPLEEVTRVAIVQHVLDALGFFAVHAMSLTSPFEGLADA